MVNTIWLGLSAVLGSTAVLGVAGSWEQPPRDVPQADISNGALRVKLYLPDSGRGYYQGTRFDWSGVIAALEYRGHNYYGPWFSRVDSRVHDYQYESAEIVGSTCSGIMGPVDEFQTDGSALGFAEAQVGGTFIKIGVGVLRKDAAKYDFVHQYEILDPGKWTIKTHADSVEFTHTLTDPANGYGYVYHKIVRLAEGKPEMVLEHHLQNTGRHTIRTNVYNHNFLVLDRQPPGPDFALTFPFQLGWPHSPSQSLVEIRGNQFVFLKPLTGKDMVFTILSGFGDNAKDNEIRIENRRVGMGMLIRGSRPLSDLHLWSIRSVLSVEPFITMTIEPGQEFTWDLTYLYYALAPDSK
jgi:hypothetical protein